MISAEYAGVAVFMPGPDIKAGLSLLLYGYRGARFLAPGRLSRTDFSRRREPIRVVKQLVICE